MEKIRIKNGIRFKRGNNTTHISFHGWSKDLDLEDEGTISSCSEYMYLGTKIEKKGHTYNEFERIMKGKLYYQRMPLPSEMISNKMKKCLYNHLLKSLKNEY